MNNSHGHVLVLHLQFHEGVRTFREVASVRHIMRSISVSCSRQRFKAGMVDLRVGRKAGGTGAPDLAMSLLAGPLVNNLMTSTWSSAMDQWWQLLICLGFQKEYQHGGVLLEDVGRCWKMLEDVGRKKYHVQTWPMWFEGSSLTISTQTKEQGSWWIRVKNTRRKLQNYFDHLTFVSRHHLEFWTLKLVLKVKCS